MIKRARVTLLVIVSMFTTVLLAACGPSADTPVAATTAAASTTSAAAATTAAATGTTAAAGATTAAAAGTGGADIRIGLMGPFTGPSSSFGTAIERGAKLALDDINAAGGINGRKIALIQRDDKATPAEGITIIKDLIDKEKVLALFGTANTAVGTGQAPIVNQSKVPWLIPVTTGTKITEEPGDPSYIFRLSMVDRYQTKFVTEYALSKYKKVALIHDDTGYGTLGKDDVLARFKERNITPVLVQSYKANGTSDDMKPLINQLKDAAPDAVINWGLGTAGGNIKKAMKELNSDFPVLGSWGLSQPELHNVGGGAESGTIVAQTFASDTTVPKQAEFVARYKSKYQTESMDFPSGVAQSYDLMRILGEALKQPGAADDRDKLRAALESFGTFDGIIKKYEKPWATTPHEAFNDKDFFFSIWKDGKLVRYNP